MNIDRRMKFRTERGQIQERRCGYREGTPRQVDMCLLSENEDGTSGHASWIRKRLGGDKPFRRNG